MLKKVKTHNELAYEMGFGKKSFAVLKVRNRFCELDNTLCSDYKSFKANVNYEYVREAADAILKYDGYEFNEVATVPFVDMLGSPDTVEFGFYVELV
jgi:hypothetical protein